MATTLSFEEASELVLAHMRERGWDKTNSTKGIAISLSLEANELLEYFQWREEPFGNRDDLESEIADIFIYAIQFADRYGIDIPSAIKKKLDIQAKKYPAEIFKIKDEKERNRRWLEAKQNFNKGTTL